MERSKLASWLVLGIVLFTFSAALAFQNTGESLSAKATKQIYLPDQESQVLLKRSPAWGKLTSDFGENVRVTWNKNSDTPHRIITQV